MRRVLVSSALAAVLGAAALGAAASLPACSDFTVHETCSDGVANHGETDVDCGGPNCAACGLGRRCAVDHDCAADASCKGGFCGKKAVGVWTPVKPAASPPARSRHALAYNRPSKSLLLFGGEGAAGGLLGDTWVYASTAWKQLTKAVAPSARADHALVEGGSRLVLFGGSSLDMSMPPVATLPNDTWTYAASTWTQLAKGTSTPAGRTGAAAAFDAARGELVLFGGAVGASAKESAETWILKGDAWSKLALSGPPALAQASMAFDAARGEVVLFGGLLSSAPLAASDTTWIWSGTDWSAREVTSGPSARYGAAMAYDSIRQRIVLFGGTDGGAALGDTWEWDGSAWLLTASEGPSPRSDAAMAYDPGSRRMVLFGGLDAGSGGDGGAASAPLADTWEYHAIGDACGSADTCATGNCVDGVCCELPGCGSCAACNASESPGVCSPCASCDMATGTCAP